MRPLAFVGLMIGSVLYLMLIRRRRSERDEVRARDASLRRGMARFVQLERQEDEVTFGFGLDDQLQVENEDSAFAVGDLGSFSGSFGEPAGATSLDIIISSRDAAGAESVVYTESVSISDPTFDTFGVEDIDLSSLVGSAPGEYVLRFYRGATKLGEGTFTIQP